MAETANGNVRLYLTYKILGADFCIVMESFLNNRDALKTYWMDYEAFDAWEDMKLNVYNKCTLTNKKREILDRTTVIRLRAAVDQQKVQEILAEVKKTEEADNDDNER